MALHPLRVLSVFSGIGWLDLGFHLGLDALGIGSRTVCYVERDAYAAAVLVARMADAALDSAVVWDNLATFDGQPWRGRVDCLIGGPPCQPYSCAGKQRGHDDERSHGADGNGPLEHLARVIGEVQPGLVFLENVPAWVRGGWFRRFGEAVSGLGFRWHPPLFLRASDVGAPHKRERVFLLAESAERGFQELRESSRCNGFTDGGDFAVDHTERIGSGEQEPGRRPNRRAAVGRASSRMADAECAVSHVTQASCGNGTGIVAAGSGEPVGDTECARPQGIGLAEPQRGRESESSGGDGGNVALFPPGPNGDWSGIAAELWPAIAPQTQSSILRMADGSAHLLDDCRADRLRCIGNGVVAAQAACAAGMLVGALNEET